MSLWRRERANLGVDSTAVAAVASADAVPVDWTAEDTVQSALREVLRPAGGHMPRRVRVLAGADLCRHWTGIAPAGVRSLHELRNIAAVRCCQLFGGQRGDWAVVADWQLARPFVCAALPSLALGALQRSAAKARVLLRIESAVLATLTRLGDHLPADGWCAWDTPTTLVLVQRQGRRIGWLATVRRVLEADAAALVAAAIRQVTQESLRRGDPRPRRLTWLPVGSVDRAALQALAADAADGVELGWSELPSGWPMQPDATGEARWAARMAAAL